jgi:ubiquinone biosynthesis monooxygenase Coq7
MPIASLCQLEMPRSAQPFEHPYEQPNSMPTLIDRLIGDIDRTLRTLSGTVSASRPLPVGSGPTNGPAVVMGEGERRHAAALMRVNHVGEVCAQALYHAQARATHDPAVRAQLEHAAQEENDHLAWTLERLDQLDGRPSLLNPLWYGGAFLIGALAGHAGDATSLGFVVETERQVEQHLNGHLLRLPPGDQESRAVLEQMSADEARHGAEAKQSGARLLPWPLRAAMRAAARVMTATAYWI